MIGVVSGREQPAALSGGVFLFGFFAAASGPK